MLTLGLVKDLKFSYLFIEKCIIEKFILSVDLTQTSLFLFSCYQRGPPVDERFWKSYCVDTDPYQWPYITIYLKDIREFPTCLDKKIYFNLNLQFTMSFCNDGNQLSHNWFFQFFLFEKSYVNRKKND